MLQKEQWQGFNGRIWREEVNLREFIQDNYTPYDGDASFLEGPTELRIRCGMNCRNCRRLSVTKVAFLIWIPRLYQPYFTQTRLYF